MNQEIQAWLDRHAENYSACLKAVVDHCDTTLELSPSDMNDIASNIYVQANNAGLFREEGDPNPPRNGIDDVPITDKQRDFIVTLSRELGKDADEIIDQQLRLCGKKSIAALTKQESTEVITLLKEAKKSK